MSTEAWSALFAAAGVVSAIVLQAIEWRRASFSRSMEMIAALDMRFEGQLMREVRRSAATYLTNPADNNKAGKESAKVVINFFETLGFLYRKGVIDAESAWHFFASWLLPYYVASEKLRLLIADGDPNVYSDFKYVYQAVKKIEESRHPSRDTIHILKPEALNLFWNDEIGSKVETIPAETPKP